MGSKSRRLWLTASVVVSGLVMTGCNSCNLLSNHSLSVGPNPAKVGAEVALTGGWWEHEGQRGPDGVTERSRWDLDGDGAFETAGDGSRCADWGDDAPGFLGDEKIIRCHKITTAYSNPATINVSHLLVVHSDYTGLLREESVARATLVVEARDNQPPLAEFSATPNPTQPGFVVQLDASASKDLDGAIVKYEWDIDGDGIFERDTGSSPFTSERFGLPLGDRIVGLRVTDDRGATATTTRTIVVTTHPDLNEPPVADLAVTPNPAPMNTEVQFDASGSDDPDGTITIFEFDLDGNGTYELQNGTDPTTSRSYSGPGEIEVGLRVTDNGGAVDTTTQTLVIVPDDPPRLVPDGGTGAIVEEGSAFARQSAKRTIVLRLPRTRDLKAGRFLLNGNKLLNLGRTVKGKTSARPFPERLQRGDRKVRWTARLDTKKNLGTERSVVRGVALLDFPAGGVACLGYKLVAPRGKAATGRFRIIGGKGKAKRLRAYGSGRGTLRSKSIRLRGRGDIAFAGKPWRTLGGHGCGKLRRQ